MLRKLAALVLVVGLVLPHGGDIGPIAVLWEAWANPAVLVFMGVPVLAALAYALHAFLPPIARFHERNGPALHGVLRALFFGLAGGYLHQGLTGEGDAWPLWLAALVVPGALLYWQQQRGTKAARLPLLLLVILGVPVLYHFVSGLDRSGLPPGAWVLAAGFVVAVVAEVQALRGAPPVTHGG